MKMYLTVSERRLQNGTQNVTPRYRNLLSSTGFLLGGFLFELIWLFLTELSFSRETFI